MPSGGLPQDEINAFFNDLDDHDSDEEEPVNDGVEFDDVQDDAIEVKNRKRKRSPSADDSSEDDLDDALPGPPDHHREERTSLHTELGTRGTALVTSPDEPVERNDTLGPSELLDRLKRKGILSPAVGKPLNTMKTPSLQSGDVTWHSTPNPALANTTNNVKRGHPTPATNIAETPADFVGLFLNDTMLVKICFHTNEKIQTLREKYKSKQSNTLGTVDLLEMKALLGILIMGGVRRDNQAPSCELWSKLEGAPLYRCAMTERRFAFLVRCLRFDGSVTRKERLKDDKLAPIRLLWGDLIRHCKEYYTPGPYLTVDDQLLAFRSNCSFRMYMPNKSAK